MNEKTYFVTIAKGDGTWGRKAVEAKPFKMKGQPKNLHLFIKKTTNWGYEVSEVSTGALVCSGYSLKEVKERVLDKGWPSIYEKMEELNKSYIITRRDENANS